MDCAAADCMGQTWTAARRSGPNHPRAVAVFEASLSLPAGRPAAARPFASAGTRRFEVIRATHQEVVLHLLYGLSAAGPGSRGHSWNTQGTGGASPDKWD